MSWLVSLLVLSALIFFHELGHYLAARLMGVCVEVFSIGLGKNFFHFMLIIHNGVSQRFHLVAM